MTTMTMVMTPTDTMITSSMLLSRGDVGLPWGLLLPGRVGEERKGSFMTQEKQAVLIKDTWNPADQQEGMDLTRNVCFLAFANCSCTIVQLEVGL